MGRKRIDDEMQSWFLALYNGELSKKDEKRVVQWLNESSENRQAYEMWVKEYLYIRWAQVEKSIDTDRALSAVLKGIKKEKRVYRPYYAIAASIAILITVSVFFFSKRYFPSATERIWMTSEIKPVSSKAILVLSSGEEIDLATHDSLIIEHNNTVLKVDKRHGLIYESGTSSSSQEMVYNKIKIPRGGEYYTRLSDGTEVWLNAESEMEYPVSFAADRREVRLKGEAYFKVSTDSTRIFTVKSGQYAINVYGTEFNLDTYDFSNFKVVLVTGAIGLKITPQTIERQLKPHQLGITNMLTEKTEIADVDIVPYTAWRNNFMIFVDEPLEILLEKTSRWYDVDVVYRNEEAKKLRFDMNLPRYADIQELLRYLELASDLRFEVKGKIIEVLQERK